MKYSNMVVVTSTLAWFHNDLCERSNGIKLAWKPLPTLHYSDSWKPCKTPLMYIKKSDGQFQVSRFSFCMFICLFFCRHNLRRKSTVDRTNSSLLLSKFNCLNQLCQMSNVTAKAILNLSFRRVGQGKVYNSGWTQKFDQLNKYNFPNYNRKENLLRLLVL